jgi:hypothetical protein
VYPYLTPEQASYIHNSAVRYSNPKPSMTDEELRVWEGRKEQAVMDNNLHLPFHI